MSWGFCSRPARRGAMRTNPRPLAWPQNQTARGRNKTVRGARRGPREARGEPPCSSTRRLPRTSRATSRTAPLAPNDKLPTVVDLCERYGVSKITVQARPALPLRLLVRPGYARAQDLELPPHHPRRGRDRGGGRVPAARRGRPCSRSPRSASSTTERPSSSPSHAATACAPSCADVNVI